MGQGCRVLTREQAKRENARQLLECVCAKCTDDEAAAVRLGQRVTLWLRCYPETQRIPNTPGVPPVHERTVFVLHVDALLHNGRRLHSVVERQGSSGEHLIDTMVAAARRLGWRVEGYGTEAVPW